MIGGRYSSPRQAAGRTCCSRSRVSPTAIACSSPCRRRPDPRLYAPRCRSSAAGSCSSAWRCRVPRKRWTALSAALTELRKAFDKQCHKVKSADIAGRNVRMWPSFGWLATKTGGTCMGGGKNQRGKNLPLSPGTRRSPESGVSWHHNADIVSMIALSAAASVGCKRESRRLWLAAASKKIGRRQEMLRPSAIRPKHGGLGGKGIDRIFFQCGTPRPVPGVLT